MTLTLTANIDAAVRYLAVTGIVPADVAPGYRFRLDDELFELQGFVQPPATTHVVRNRWYVRRGLDLSVAASHTAGAGVKGAADAFVSGSDEDVPDPFAGGGSFSGDASDVPLASEVAGASDVQGALEAIANVLSTVVDLDASQLNHLFTAPVELVPAPGAGKMLVYISGTLLPKPGTTPFSNDPNVYAYYESVAGDASQWTSTASRLATARRASSRRTWVVDLP